MFQRQNKEMKEVREPPNSVAKSLAKHTMSRTNLKPYSHVNIYIGILVRLFDLFFLVHQKQMWNSVWGITLYKFTWMYPFIFDTIGCIQCLCIARQFLFSKYGPFKQWSSKNSMFWKSNFFLCRVEVTHELIFWNSSCLTLLVSLLLQSQIWPFFRNFGIFRQKKTKKKQNKFICGFVISRKDVSQVAWCPGKHLTTS